MKKIIFTTFVFHIILFLFLFNNVEKREHKDIDLEIGDLILLKNTAIVSKIITGLQNNYEYSHVVMVIPDNKTIEIDAPKFFNKGVIMIKDIKQQLENSEKYKVLRLKNKPKDFEFKILESIEYYKKYQDSIYFDWFLSNENDSLYCVELIDEIYKKNNLNIFNETTLRVRNNKNVMLPIDLKLDLFEEIKINDLN